MIEKLLRVQAELKANKSQFNKFGNYHYRSCEDILEAVKPLLKREGLLMTINDEVINILDRVYVMAHVVITDGTKQMETSALAREALNQKGMSDSQITGSASSYARKYALSGMFLIDDTKDDDTRDHKDAPKNEPQKSGSNQKNNAVDKIINTLDAVIVDCNSHIQQINDAPISEELKADLIAKYNAKDDNVKEAFFKGFIQNKLRG